MSQNYKSRQSKPDETEHGISSQKARSERILITMDKRESLEILESIIKSVKENKNQFNFAVNVSVAGMIATATHGGIGAVGIANAPNSTGIHASASTKNIDTKIVQEATNQKIEDRIKKMSDILEDFKTEASKEDAKSSVLKSILDMGKGILPHLIIAILTKTFGL